MTIGKIMKDIKVLILKKCVWKLLPDKDEKRHF